MISLIKVTTNAIKQTKIYKWLIKFWSVCILAGCLVGNVWCMEVVENGRISPEEEILRAERFEYMDSCNKWQSALPDMLRINPLESTYNWYKWTYWGSVYALFRNSCLSALDCSSIVAQVVEKLEEWQTDPPSRAITGLLHGFNNPY